VRIRVKAIKKTHLQMVHNAGDSGSGLVLRGNAKGCPKGTILGISR
jgi:hypothetical protein